MSPNDETDFSDNDEEEEDECGGLARFALYDETNLRGSFDEKCRAAEHSLCHAIEACTHTNLSLPHTTCSHP